MALVNIYGTSEAAATEGWGDCTHRRLEPALAALLPNGWAWDREDPVQKALIAAHGAELSRVEVRAAALERELDPSTTFELLPDWEEMLGLPDCAQPVTLEARQAAVIAKLLAQAGHDQGLGYWLSVLEALMYPLQWLEKSPLATSCIDTCNSPLFSDEWEAVWSLVIESGLDDALLACVVNHQALIHTLPKVHVLWQQAGVTNGDEFIRAIASTMNGYTVAIGEDAALLRAKPGASEWEVC
ncbi:DUF2313 domain-containing protein [Nannocystis pusilla]|uniref:DUF2313 domain-containing protein n=1 Tax=Nannocystis pusilla TaxID=889268 RepID=A0A9X3EH96_9BACT|nr:DUF2313 domain-containing protein [Nannocystis pusilla]